MQGLGPYSGSIKKAEKEIKEMAKNINDLCGVFLVPTLISPTFSLSLSKLILKEQSGLCTNTCFYRK